MWNGRQYFLVPESDLRARVTAAVKRQLDRATKSIARRTSESVADGSSDNEEKVQPVTSSLITNVLQALRSLVLVPASVEQPAWIGDAQNEDRGPVIAMSNDLVDLEALLAGRGDVLRPHSPDWFSPVCLPYPYDPDATCPMYDVFLAEVFEADEERIALSHEWFGYHLTADTSQQKFLIGVGDGANGKQVWIEVLTGLLGAENVSHVPLEVFKERFQLAATVGKLANIATEIGEIDKVAEGILKAFTSGDRMHFDRKNQEPLQARPTARLTLTGNSLPGFRDQSGGLWRRVIVLPFNVRIPTERQDPELAQKLRAELPGIFNRAVEGLRRLRTQKRFTEPAICRLSLEEYRNERDSARAYLLEQVSVLEGSSIECSVLYQQYQWWCGDEGREITSPMSFGKAVSRLFGGRRRRGSARLGRDRPWVYAGLTCRATSERPPVGVPRGSRRQRADE